MLTQLFTVTAAIASSSTVDSLPPAEGIAIARGRHRRGPLPFRFTYMSSSLDVYGRFGVYFFTLYTKEAVHRHGRGRGRVIRFLPL